MIINVPKKDLPFSLIQVNRPIWHDDKMTPAAHHHYAFYRFAELVRGTTWIPSFKTMTFTCGTLTGRGF